MEKALKPPLQVLLLVAAHAGDLKKVRRDFGLAFSGFALRKVLLPLVIRQGVLLQLSGILGCALISQADDLVGVREVEDGECTQVGCDLGVSETQGTPVVSQGHDVDCLSKKTRYAFEILASDQRRTYVHSDYDVGVHLPSDIGWNVIDQASVGENLAVEFNGREQARNGQGRAQGLGQGAVLEDDSISAEHVGSNAAKRDGQIVEAGDRGIGERDAIQKQADALACGKAEGTAQSVLETELGWNLVSAAVLFAAIGKLGIAGLAGHGFIPMNGFDKLAHLGG